MSRPRSTLSPKFPLSILCIYIYIYMYLSIYLSLSIYIYITFVCYFLRLISSDSGDGGYLSHRRPPEGPRRAGPGRCSRRPPRAPPPCRLVLFCSAAFPFGLVWFAVLNVFSRIQRSLSGYQGRFRGFNICR